jgi:hypothetical protein
MESIITNPRVIYDETISFYVLRSVVIITVYLHHREPTRNTCRLGSSFIRVPCRLWIVLIICGYVWYTVVVVYGTECEDFKSCGSCDLCPKCEDFHSYILELKVLFWMWELFQSVYDVNKMWYRHVVFGSVALQFIVYFAKKLNELEKAIQRL